MSLQNYVFIEKKNFCVGKFEFYTLMTQLQTVTENGAEIFFQSKFLKRSEQFHINIANVRDHHVVIMFVFKWSGTGYRNSASNMFTYFECVCYALCRDQIFWCVSLIFHLQCPCIHTLSYIPSSKRFSWTRISLFILFVELDQFNEQFRRVAKCKFNLNR